MRAVFLQSPAAALATAVCISVPAVAPHAIEAARAEEPSVALAASTSTLAEALTETLPKLKLVLSPSGTGTGLELLALPESIAKQVQSGGINAVPNTFIEAGRTAGANIMSDLNAAASASPLAAAANPLDSLLAAYNAVINFLAGPSTSTFTSVYGLVQGVGNFLLLPISIGGLLLGGGSAQIRSPHHQVHPGRPDRNPDFPGLHRRHHSGDRRRLRRPRRRIHPQPGCAGNAGSHSVGCRGSEPARQPPRGVQRRD